MRPPFLQSGDTIALICTARWLTNEQCDQAKGVVEAHGLRLKVAPHATSRHFQLAGTIEERLADLHGAFQDEEVKGILIGRGGYGTVQLLDRLNMDLVNKYPKWVAGFSDVTSLLAHLNTNRVAAIHCPMPGQFESLNPHCLHTVFDAFKGTRNAITWTGECSENWIEKSAARLLGGNLSVLCSLLDSPSWQPKEPYYLMIEDLDEMLYHLDRMLYALARSASAKLLKGVLVGGFSDFKDNTIAFGFNSDNPWGSAPNQIIQAWSDRFAIPIITGFPIGHQAENQAVYVGVSVVIEKNGPSTFVMNWVE